MTAISRVLATDATLALIARLKARYGPLMFHQSGGCCDGSAPMCFPEGELLVGDSDVLLGEIGGCPFYMRAAIKNLKIHWLASRKNWKYSFFRSDSICGESSDSPSSPSRKEDKPAQTMVISADCAIPGAQVADIRRIALRYIT